MKAAHTKAPASDGVEYNKEREVAEVAGVRVNSNSGQLKCNETVLWANFLYGRLEEIMQSFVLTNGKKQVRETICSR